MEDVNRSAKGKIMRYCFALLFIIFTACSPVVTPPTSTITPISASSTPTNIPYTLTPEATIYLSPINEIDLQPNYEQNVSVEFMGVKINASLITDKSLDPVITKVTVGENAYAEFIARSIFKVWWAKGEIKHTGTPTEQDFKDFMTNWSTAQKTGLTEDWRKVQVNNIWANDLKDGNGYVQKQETMWFMHDGETPEGVRGISKMSIALVSGGKVNNISMFKDNAYQEGWGTNIDNHNLFVYCTYMDIDAKNRISGLLGLSYWWIAQNTGRTMSGYPSRTDRSLYKFLLEVGISVQ